MFKDVPGDRFVVYTHPAKARREGQRAAR